MSRAHGIDVSKYQVFFEPSSNPPLPIDFCIQRTGYGMMTDEKYEELWEGVNDNSVVARLTYGQVSVLLPGDIEAAVEQALVGAHRVGTVREPPLLQSTVLKVGHHGSCSSTTPAFLEAVDPELVVISVGADNRFGHPCDEVLERLQDVTTYRTDEHGAVEIVTDGTQVQAETER